MNTLFIISGSSGSGKTTLTNMLIKEKDLDLERGVTYTGRPRRENEDATAYEFISNRRLDELTLACPDLFIEYNIYAGNIYATPISIIEKLLFHNIILVEDVNGKEKIESKYRDKFKIDSIFLKSDRLEENLRGRGEDSEEIALRTDSILLKNEEEKSKKYDYIVVNKDLNETFLNLRGIIEKELKKED